MSVSSLDLSQENRPQTFNEGSLAPEMPGIGICPLSHRSSPFSLQNSDDNYTRETKLWKNKVEDFNNKETTFNYLKALSDKVIDRIRCAENYETSPQWDDIHEEIITISKELLGKCNDPSIPLYTFTADYTSNWNQINSIVDKFNARDCEHQKNLLPKTGD